MNYSVHFETLGCKLNQIETESAARAFSEFGFNISLETATASSVPVKDTFLCVVNTCTVTGKAEQKARRIIRLLEKLYPDAVILVTGCYAQVEPETIRSLGSYVAVLPGIKKDLLAKIPEICYRLFEDSKSQLFQNDTSLQNTLFNMLSAAILKSTSTSDEKMDNGNPFIENNSNTGNIQGISLATARFTLSTDTFARHTRASIKIQDGCDNRCAYCRICIARGKSVSLDANKVLERIKLLESQNQHEVVLTGVNLSQYSSSYENRSIDIAGLLDMLLANTEFISFRFSSLYPDRIDENFCRVLANPRVCPHFHLSVQSGSTTILHSMGRRYGSEAIIESVRRLREIKSNPFIACDIIAGFPGETSEDFNQTMEVCHKCNFTWIHAFPFSPRPGTKAYSMKPAIPQNIAKNRVKRLTELARQNKIDYITSFIGKTVPAIIQTGKGKVAQAVTANFLHVQIKLPDGILTEQIERKLIDVKITGALKDCINNDDELEAEAVLL